jgi:transketolase
MLHEALLASDYIIKIGFGLKVINMPWLNKIDKEWLKEIVKDQKKIFVLEDHSAVGGLGDRLLNVMNELNILEGKTFLTFGLKEYPECGTPWEVLNYHKLDGKSLAQRISGIENIEGIEKIKQRYTKDAPQ